MLNLIVDTSKQGLSKVLRKYQELALRYVWEIGDRGVNSRLVYFAVNEELPSERSISRASIIFFLNDMVDEGVLGFRDATGKGGHHRVYYPLMDESEYIKQIVYTCITSLIADFREETTLVLEEVLRE